MTGQVAEAEGVQGVEVEAEVLPGPQGRGLGPVAGPEGQVEGKALGLHWLVAPRREKFISSAVASTGT